MNNQKQQKPTLTGQRFKTRKRGWPPFSFLSLSFSVHTFIHFLTSDLCSFLVDEKERFDPTQFQESIVQGLNQSGTDLEAVAKFLDASGGKLDYRRYAETLFDILVAGGMLGEFTSACLGLAVFLSACFSVGKIMYNQCGRVRAVLPQDPPTGWVRGCPFLVEP